MGLKISYLRQVDGETARAYSVKKHWRLPKQIRLRQDLTVAQAAEKLGCRTVDLVALGISAEGINLPKLREALSMSVPAGVSLRRGEVSNHANLLSAVIGRLGDEATVLEPADLEIQTSRDEAMPIELRTAILIDYLNRNYVHSAEIMVEVVANIDEEAKVDRNAIFLAIKDICPDSSGKLYDFYMAAKDRILASGPTLGEGYLEWGIENILERIGWIDERPILIPVYGFPDDGKSFLMSELVKRLKKFGIQAAASGGYSGELEFQQIKQLMAWSRSTGSFYDVFFFHCCWLPRCGDKELKIFARSILGQRIHLTIGIYNPRHGKWPPDRNLLVDMIIANPDSKIKLL